MLVRVRLLTSLVGSNIIAAPNSSRLRRALRSRTPLRLSDDATTPTRRAAHSVTGGDIHPSARGQVALDSCQAGAPGTGHVLVGQHRARAKLCRPRQGDTTRCQLLLPTIALRRQLPTVNVLRLQKQCTDNSQLLPLLSDRLRAMCLSATVTVRQFPPIHHYGNLVNPVHRSRSMRPRRSDEDGELAPPDLGQATQASTRVTAARRGQLECHVARRIHLPPSRSSIPSRPQAKAPRRLAGLCPTA